MTNFVADQEQGGARYRIAIRIVIVSSFRYKRRELPLSCRDSRPENSNQPYHRGLIPRSPCCVF